MDPAGVSHRAFLRNRYFDALDGLRCLSIVAVIWHHAGGHAGGLLGRGHKGVELFFAISGFLITTLLLREQDAAGQVSLRGFYIRRTLRIFPLYYAVLFAYAALVAVVERDSAAGAQFWRNLPAFLTYTSNWFVDLGSGARVIFYFAWSLATEEQFYLVWPWVVRFAGRWYVPVLFMAGLFGVDQAAEWATAAGALDGRALPVRMVTSIATPICLGSLAAYLLHRPGGFRWVHPIVGQRWSPLAALVLMGVALGFEDTPPLLLHLSMVYLVVSCCVRSDHLLRGLFANPIARHGGTISYGMYLLHMLAMNAARRIAPGAPDVVIFVLALALSITVATVSYRVFERPFLRLKERFGRRPLPAAAQL